MIVRDGRPIWRLPRCVTLPKVATEPAVGQRHRHPLLPFELDGLITALRRYGSAIPSVNAGDIADGQDAVLLVPMIQGDAERS